MDLSCEPFPLLDKTRNNHLYNGRSGQKPIARTIPITLLLLFLLPAINRQDHEQIVESISIGKSNHQPIVRTISINRPGHKG